MSEPKHDETFKVVDRRLFTAEGELRKEVAEQQDREHEAAEKTAGGHAAGKRSTATSTASTSGGATGKPAPRASTPAAPEEAPRRLLAFENLIRWLGQNAAMLMGGYADPRTGQPVMDLEGAREMIDMLDALREKTRASLAPEEDALILEIGGNLKLAFMEMTKAATAAEKNKAKSRT